jgi:hypothetical protein
MAELPIRVSAREPMRASRRTPTLRHSSSDIMTSTTLLMHHWRFPSRVAALGFGVALPSDWNADWLPDEDPNFGDAGYLMPLAAVSTRTAAVCLTVSARPAYEEGSVSDWAWQLLELQGLPRPALHEYRMGDLPALVGESVGYSAKGLTQIRFAFAEDGQRLIRMMLRAPYVLADAVDSVWFSALDSFTLEDPFGPTVTLWSPAEAARSSEAPRQLALNQH